MRRTIVPYNGLSRFMLWVRHIFSIVSGQFRAIPLARRIVFLTITMLIVVYSGNILILGHYYDTIAAQEHDSRDAKAELLAEHAGRAMAAVDLSLETIAKTLQAHLPIEQPTIFTQLLLDEHIKRLPQVRSIFVLDSEGNSVNNSRAFPPPPINDADRPFFFEQKKWRGIGLYIDHIEISRADHKPFFAMSRPILDNDGNFRGIVAAITDPQYFANYYGPRGEETSDVTLLEREDGSVLAGAGLPNETLTRADKIRSNNTDQANVSVREVHGFPAKIVVISSPAIASPQFVNFVSINLSLMIVMTAIAIWLARAAAREATRVNQEAAARQTAEGRMLSAIESAPAGFALFDQADQLVLSNHLYRSYFDPVKDLIVPGTTFKELAEAAITHHAYADQHLNDEHFLRWRIEQHRTGQGEPFIQLRDGRWVLTRERRTKEGDTVMFYTDITPLKEREEELKAARQLAEQSNKAKTAFLATMSHELRTPLNAIIGFSEMTEHAVMGPISETYRHYGEIVRTSGQHLLAIINDILDVAKLNSGKTELHLESLDIDQIISEAVSIISPKADTAQIRIVTNLDTRCPKIDARCAKIDGRCPKIEADPIRLRQVLLNLLTNAVKFTPPGGRIEVSTSIVADELQIAVKDTGIGMAPEDIPRALEPFTQVGKDKTGGQEGTGLGLPISKSLIELHGGRFEITSAPKQGTTVTISLPIHCMAHCATETPPLDIAV